MFTRPNAHINAENGLSSFCIETSGFESNSLSYHIDSGVVVSIPIEFYQVYCASSHYSIFFWIACDVQCLFKMAAPSNMDGGGGVVGYNESGQLSHGCDVI